MKEKIKTLLLLHALLLMMSFTGVLSKLASGHPFLSKPFILLYGGMLAILFVYAVGWQWVLKKMDLTVAFANRACSLVYSLVFGALIFREEITVNKILGCVLAVAGVLLYVSDNQEGTYDA